MRVKKIVAAISAAVLGASLLPALATPAQAHDNTPVSATDADARALWEALALRELQRITDTVTSGGDLGLNVITQSYQAELLSLKYKDSGGWNHSSTQSALQEVIDLFKETSNVRGNAGYNMGQTADAFSDGSTNTADTIYTVTMTDHVGPVFLKAAQAGALPASEIYFLIDSIMAIPVKTFPFGKCSVYSDAPADAHYCVFNVTASVGGFLQDALDAGYSRPGQQQLITDLAAGLSATYEQGGAVKGWPYGYGGSTAPKFTNSYWGSFTANEDLNHAGLTNEAARKIGLTVKANESTTHHLRYPDYPEYNTSLPTADWYKRPREIMGRIRLQSAMPSTYPQNALRDALWYETFTLPKTASEYAQLGMWAKRLSENASRATTQPYSIASITTPVVSVNGNVKTGNPVMVNPGQKIVVSSTVKNADGVKIVNKKVGGKLVAWVDGNFFEEKSTGHVGNVALTYTMPSTSGTQRCIELQHVGEFTSSSVCVKTN